MIISLTGFMGCGKSSVGKHLSGLLRFRFADLDDLIETREGCSVAEIFDRYGEKEFRRIEKETLYDIVAREEEGMVLALGGGAVMTRECEEAVHGKTVCIYLKASIETLMEHLEGETGKRPILASESHSGLRNRIETLMSLRSETYERTAHVIIDTDGKSIDEIASEIMSAIAD